MTSRLLTWNEDALGAKTWNHIIPADQIRDNLLPSVRTKVESGLRSGALMTEFSRADIDAMSDAERRILDVIDFKFYYNETRPDRAAKTGAAFAASGNAFAYFRQFVVTIARQLGETDVSLPKTQAEWADKFHNFIDTHKTALELEDRIQAVAMQNGLMCQACANELAFPKNARPVTTDEQELADSDIHDKAKLARRKERYDKWVAKAKSEKLSSEDLEQIKSPLVQYIETNRNVTATKEQITGVKQGLLGAAVGIGGAILTVPAIGAVAGAAIIGGVMGYFSSSGGKTMGKHTCGIYGGEKTDMPNMTNYLENRDQFTEVVRHLNKEDLSDLPKTYKALEDWRQNANEAAMCVSIQYLHNVARKSRVIRQNCKNALPRYLRSYNNGTGAVDEIKFAHSSLSADLDAVVTMASAGLRITLDPRVDVVTPQLAYSLLVAMYAAGAPPATTSWGTSGNWGKIEASLMDSSMAGRATSKLEASMMAIVFSRLNFESGRVSDRDIDATIDQLQATSTRYLSIIINAVRALNISVNTALESMLCEAGAFREEKYGKKKLTFGGKEIRYNQAKAYKIACDADTAVGADPNYLGRGRRRVCVTDYKVCDSDLYQRVDKKAEPRSVFDTVSDARELVASALSWLAPGRSKPEAINYTASAHQLRSQLLSTTKVYRDNIVAGKPVKTTPVEGDKCDYEGEDLHIVFRNVQFFFNRILNAMGGDARQARKKIIKDDKVEASFYTPEFTKYLLDMVLAKLDNDTDAAASAVNAEETGGGDAAAVAAVVSAVAKETPMDWKDRFQLMTNKWNGDPVIYDTLTHKEVVCALSTPGGQECDTWCYEDDVIDEVCSKKVEGAPNIYGSEIIGQLEEYKEGNTSPFTDDEDAF